METTTNQLSKLFTQRRALNQQTGLTFHQWLMWLMTTLHFCQSHLATQLKLVEASCQEETKKYKEKERENWKKVSSKIEPKWPVTQQ